MKLRSEVDCKGFYESQAAAIDRIEEIIKAENIDCDFRRLDGYLFQAPETDRKMIDDELEAVRKVGAPVHRLVGVPLEGCGDRHALRYPRQATFHPLKYLKALAEKIVAKGGLFFADTVITEVVEEDSRVTVTSLDGAKVRASAAVVATNSPISDLFALHTKMAPYRSYAMAFEIKAGALPDALYWDTLDPYHYVRLQPGEKQTDYVIVGGEDHKSGEADDADAASRHWKNGPEALYPRSGRSRINGRDRCSIPSIMRASLAVNPGNEHIYVHTGDSGQGMTHGVAGAMINAALILGELAPWVEVYDPSRKTPVRHRQFP